MHGLEGVGQMNSGNLSEDASFLSSYIFFSMKIQKRGVFNENTKEKYFSSLGEGQLPPSQSTLPTLNTFLAVDSIESVLKIGNPNNRR